MKFGICLPIRRDTSLEFNINLSIKAEELGFDSVWASDHVVVPNEQVGRFTKYFYDPFILLSAVASETKKIKLGTSLIVLPYRNPVVLAKIISTLDVLSEGRVLFGVATGWLKKEFESLGVPFEKRGMRTNEYLEAISVLWSEDNPNYQGKYVNFSDISFLPKPYQKPHPKIIVGGNSDFAISRAAKYATGWQPTWITPSEMKESVRKLKDYLKKYNRDENDFILSVRNRIVPDAYALEYPECYFGGSIRNISELIEQYVDIGVSHILFDPECENDEQTYELIERLASEFIN